MSTALYRRYRPDSFAEMIGQEHVTAPLMQALRSNRVNHAYLFSGPRGCGKTTSARILARILNCAQNTEANPTDTPCGQCPSCIELARGGSGSLDVVEIDAASHGGVDDARDLRERATFSPTRDRFKIFILDEAHMVTAQGFNALLKIVEEPPPYLKFIFATTEPDKVIGTIRSRTHHYPFKLVAPEIMNNYLEQLCAAEGIIARDGVLPLVVRAGGGSVRDTLSVLDQLIAGAAGGVLEYDHAVALLGFTPATLLDEVVEALGSRNGGSLFRVVEQVVQTGHEPRRFVEDLLERLRDLVVISLSGDSAAAVLPAVPADQLTRMQNQASMMGAAELSRAADVANAALTEMSGATSPRLHLELLCARLLLPAADASASGLGARIDGIERAIATGVSLGDAPRGLSNPRTAPSDVGLNNANSLSSEAIPQGPATSQGAGERKSLRPESTRRKPTSPDAGADVPGTSATQGGQGGGVTPGSMFAASAPTGIFGVPAASPSDSNRPEPVRPETGQAAPAQPETQQQGLAEEPTLPTHVGAYDGPRDEQGRPLAANTGWYTVDSRQPHATSVTPGATSGSAVTEQDQRTPAPPAAQRQQAQSAVEPQNTPSVQQAAPDVAPAPTASQQAPAQQQATRSNETEVFKQRWPEVVDALNAMSRATGALIGQYATVEHLDAQRLYLGFPNENLLRPFAARQGDSLVAAAVKTVLGFDVQVIADVQGSPRFPKAGSSTDPAAAAPPHSPGPEAAQSAPQQSTVASPLDRPQSSAASPVEHEPNQSTQSGGGDEGTEYSSQSGGSVNGGLPQAGQQPNQTPEAQASQPEPGHTAAQQQPSGPTPFDPLAAVSIFGAAVGAFANAQPNPTPVVPRLGETTGNIVDNLAAQRQAGHTAIAPVASPETHDDPESGGYSDAPAYDDLPQEPPADDWGAPAPEAEGHDAVSGWGSATSPEDTPTTDPSASSPGEPLHTNAGRAHSGTSAGSPAGATQGQSIPPWEETPRQAAARRAAELAAREAERQQVMDDPQPDDEDLESSNLVGVPLVMSMFGATIIDESTDEH